MTLSATGGSGSSARARLDEVFREPFFGIATVSLRLLVATALAFLWLSLAIPTFAQTPTPGTSPVLIDPLDPRAGDESVNLVGTPLLAVVVVVASGALVAVGTVAYVKLTARRGEQQ